MNAITKKYDLIDITKFIFAIMIVALHSTLYNAFGETGGFYISGVFFRTAVPFFFCVTGFLFASKYNTFDDKKSTLLRSLKRLVVLWLSWSIVEFVYLLIGSVVLHKSVIEFITSYLKSFVMLSDGVRWYIQVSILAIALLALVQKNKSLRPIVLALSLLLYVANVISTYFADFGGATLCRIISLLPIWKGFVFVILGGYVAEYGYKIKRASIKLIISVVLLLIELTIVFFVIKNTDVRVDYYLALIPFTFYLLVMLTKSGVAVKNAKLFRNMSTVMYMTHSMILTLFKHFIGNYIILFVAGLVVTIVLSYVFIECSKKIEFLKKMY